MLWECYGPPHTRGGQIIVYALPMNTAKLIRSAVVSGCSSACCSGSWVVVTEAVWLTKPKILSGPIHKRFANSCRCCTRAPGQESQRVLKYSPPLSSWGVPLHTGHTACWALLCSSGWMQPPGGRVIFSFHKGYLWAWAHLAREALFLILHKGVCVCRG